MRTRILGTGSCLPDNVVTNDDLAKIVDTSDEWIYSRTGIRKRRIAVKGKDTTGTLAVAAARRALDNAHLSADDIDVIIVATSSADYAFPNTASIVQMHLGASDSMCMDISAACTGFIYALSIAEAYIQSGQFCNALVIGADIVSSHIDWKERSSCVLFGDGAGAVVLGISDKAQNSGKFSCLHADGSKGYVLTSEERAKRMDNIVDRIHMDGQEVFKFAVKKVPEAIEEVLLKADVKKEEIKYFVLHQANIRIIESVARRLGIKMDKFPSNLNEYGNTSAASIPILLDELNRSGKLTAGDRIVMAGFGAGLSWGSTLMEW